MNTTMKVSCIVPVYNTSRYVGKCVDSILSQTYNNIEIVLVNDSFTDKSDEVCRSYASKNHDKIILIDKLVNEGVDKARCAGLGYVSDHNKLCAGNKLYREETLATSGLQPTRFKMREHLMFKMKLFR